MFSYSLKMKLIAIFVISVWLASAVFASPITVAEEVAHQLDLVQNYLSKAQQVSLKHGPQLSNGARCMFFFPSVKSFR